jgi:hypothetical protein
MILRAQIGFPLDSALPRDVVTVNPHFNGDDPNALADGLVTNLKAITEIGAARSFTVKVYNAQKAPPSYPLAERVNATGFSTSTKPREVGMCLSFFSVNNRPSQRGRIYVPGIFISGTFDLRPSPAQRTIVGNWASAMVNGLATHSQWCVYSRKFDTGYAVTDWFVDDEWDIVRSRGLRPTTRLTGTV